MIRPRPAHMIIAIILLGAVFVVISPTPEKQLREGVKINDPLMVRDALNEGAFADLLDREGLTLLEAAVADWHLEVANELVLGGANPNMPLKGDGLLFHGDTIRTYAKRLSVKWIAEDPRHKERFDQLIDSMEERFPKPTSKPTSTRKKGGCSFRFYINKINGSSCEPLIYAYFRLFDVCSGSTHTDPLRASPLLIEGNMQSSFANHSGHASAKRGNYHKVLF